MELSVTPGQVCELNEISVTVNHKREGAILQRYKVKFTGNNFVFQRPTDEDEKNGLTGRLYSRVPVKDLMTVKSLGIADYGCKSIHRYIYCLPDQRQVALCLLIADMDKLVVELLDGAQKLFKSWTERNKDAQPKAV